MKELTAEEQKRILLKILINVDAFCRKHNIQYSIGEGTLIGAIRHKGFIPWDDDIDLLMTRNEFNKFLEEYTDSHYKIFHVNKKTNYWNTVIRITDPSTAVFPNGSKSSWHGLWVSIIPVDYVADSDTSWEKDKKSIARWISLCRMKKFRFTSNNRIVNLFVRCTPLSYFNNRLVKVLSKYKDNHTSRVMKFEVDYEPMLFPAWYFEGGYIEKEFEGRMFKVMKNYDAYLRHYYGDYMTPPPVENQVATHHFRAYYTEEQ